LCGTQRAVPFAQQKRNPLGETAAGGNIEKAVSVEVSKGDMGLASVLPIRKIPHLHPDYHLETALCYVDEWPLLPVVSRVHPYRLDGVLTKQDVFRSYRQADEDVGLSS